MKLPFLHTLTQNRKKRADALAEAKLAREERNRKLDELHAELQAKVQQSKNELKELQTMHEKYHPVDATEEIQKKTIFDKIKKQKVIIEVDDGERQKEYNAKVIDGIYITWKQGRTKFKKIIASQPRRYERSAAFGLWYDRGIKYYILKHAETTKDPKQGSFNVRQIKHSMRLMKAIQDAEMHQEMAKATKGKNKIELYFIIAIIIISVVGIMASGGYFK